MRRYASRQYALLASGFGIQLAVRRIGQFKDNALAESFFAGFKFGVEADRPGRAGPRLIRNMLEYVEAPAAIQCGD
ncbi:hypothetical protein [Embleya sp. NPDC050493]|uniref:hypothetical protein n=1 Tax=Embleya sp. NPDC050493 TaxID=3363989 RepID=UPI003790D9CB